MPNSKRKTVASYASTCQVNNNYEMELAACIESTIFVKDRYGNLAPMLQSKHAKGVVADIVEKTSHARPLGKGGSCKLTIDRT